MDYEGEAALEPGEARVEDEINETDQRGELDAALDVVQPLLHLRHCGVFTGRHCCVRPTIAGPVAIVSMVIVVVPGPHVLRHSRDHTQHKAETAIQACIAEQA